MKNTCQTGSGTCARTVIGALFLIVAVALTILTHDGAGILGMFIAGTVFCVKRSSGCNPCGGCGTCACCCGCNVNCGPEMSCDAPPKKVTKPRKTKKTA